MSTYSSGNIFGRFKNLVSLYPDSKALIFPKLSKSITYKELLSISNHFCSSFIKLNIQKGDVLAIFHDKSEYAYGCLIACIRLGVIYVNLDSSCPISRLRSIYDNCAPKLLIGREKAIERISQCDIMQEKYITYEALIANSDNSYIESNHFPDVNGSDPVYIMYTSGSTGNPKGAVISNNNLQAFIDWSIERFAITHQDVLTSLNPLYFDNSVFDTYVSLLSGATLAVISQEDIKNPFHLIELVHKAECTIWFSVPSLLIYLLKLKQFKEGTLPTIRKIIFGGEGFPKRMLKELYDIFFKQADLENVYGPTECTCICSSHTIRDEDFEEMNQLAPLGRLSKNFSASIVSNHHLDPSKGELCLSGSQVCLGYFNDSERSNSSFVQNPSHNKYIDRSYLTGDIVSRNKNGLYIFHGRQDFQIKHQGHRIELEEIECSLSLANDVLECAVIYYVDELDVGKIYGFIVISGEEHNETISNVMKELSNLVPSYMVPQEFLILPELPKNPNGKIDRSKLYKLVQ